MTRPIFRISRLLLAPIFVGAALIPSLACKSDEAAKTDTVSVAKTAIATIKAAGAAATQPANKAVSGTVTFTETKDGVKAVADLTGLSPGKHGIHIHEKVDMSDPELKSAGGHWDPDGHKQHGGPSSEADKRHAGDLGNLEADADGKSHYEVTLSGVSIGGKNDIIGHSIVVHAMEDDMKTNPAGNAGGRVAAGAIELKK